MNLYTDPSKRHDFVYLFDVTNGNPNGDPDAGNLPRLDPETMHGLVTDVCLKRKVRDYVALVKEKPIFIQSQTALNTLITKAFWKVGVVPPQAEVENEELLEWLQEHIDQMTGFDLQDRELIYSGETVKEGNVRKELLTYLEELQGPPDLKDALNKLANDLATAAKGDKGKISRETRQKAQEKMAETYFDIRLFGAVLSTGLNAGQVRGPMQLTFARSLSPIVALDLSITRVAITREADRARKETEMGRKPLVPYGLYRAHGFFSPALATKTGVTSEDLAIFWEALQNMFEHDHSAARGEMVCRGLYIFTHNSPQGNAPAHKLFEQVQLTLRTDIPRRFGDYQLTAPPAGELTAFPGVTLTVLAS
ncbi:MAG: type I-C CRISPR-associated protein Cas7/Csd2 [Desulfobacca sp.]|uniref:type I-C CRISPR-associated protein Cas7/Csd2 n=1 Tax=Desulfobacca sp. TaxID=2067990 RepID=UPI004049F169